ncbi:MAG TPA: chemotaxis protein CheB [Thermoanaerobaculia bacterium]|nr:chemotaxis protein CheB [Thermoanaerobaculia bacterium]
MKRSTGRSDEGTVGDFQGYEIIVVGTSWGGLAAVRAILSALPADFDIPIVVVQHRHRDSESNLAGFLTRNTHLRVCDVEDKMPIEPGRLYFAPPDYHTMVENGFLALSTEAPVRYSRPSIDVMLTSAADAYERRTIGVILTGANADGAQGLRRVADVGGLAIVQDPATAEVATMPEAAIAAVPQARVFPLERIAGYLATLPSIHAARGQQ